MDIKQLVLAAAGCLSYLVRATPTPGSTALANRSSDTGLQPTPEGRLSSFDVTARHIPPYMQKIIDETFQQRELQQAKEAHVESSYEDVELEIGGQSLFREKKQALLGSPIVITSPSDPALTPKVVRTEIPNQNGGFIYSLAGVGVPPLRLNDLRTIKGQLDPYKNILCSQPLAVRGYSIKLGNYPQNPFSYIGCRPNGTTVKCDSGEEICSETPALVIPLLETGIEIYNDGESGGLYNFVSQIIYPLGNFRGFSWGGFPRYYVSDANLVEVCNYVQDLCADYLRGCRDQTITFTVTPSVTAQGTSSIRVNLTQSSRRVSATSLVPSSSSVVNPNVRYSTYQSCPPVLTTSVSSASSSSAPPSSPETSSAVVSPSIESTSECRPVKETVVVLQASPTEVATVNQTGMLASGAVGAAVGGIFILGVAGAVKIMSNKLKKGEVPITPPVPLPAPAVEEEIYSEVRDVPHIDLSAYPPLPRNGVPPSRALLNRTYGRVRTVSEGSSNFTDGTDSTEVTAVSVEVLTEVNEDPYLEMKSTETTVYNIPRLSTYDTPAHADTNV